MADNITRGQRYKKLFSDTMAFTVSNFASKFLVFLLIPLYTSALSTEEYGIADLITNTINVIYPILTLSIMEATLRFAFQKETDVDSVLINSIFVLVVGELIVILLFPIVSIFSEELYDNWIWFCIIFGGFNLHQVLSQYVKGIGKTKIFAISGVVHTIVLLTANIVLLLVFKVGLHGYLGAISLGYIVTSMFLIIVAKIRIKLFKINRSLLKEMLIYSIPTIPTLIAWWISSSADKYIIIAYRGIEESGIYSVAYKIPSLLTTFTNVFSSAWMISAIANSNSVDKEQYQSVVYKFFNFVNIIACSIMIIFSQLLGKLLFAKDFYIAWKCVPMLLVAYLFAGLAGFLASSFRAAKCTSGLFGSAVVGAVINILLNIVAIYKYGMMGAAITTMIGFGITFYIRERKIKQIISINTDIGRSTIAYFLLIMQALIIGCEINYSYYFGGIILFVLLNMYREEVFVTINKVSKMFRKK